MRLLCSVLACFATLAFAQDPPKIKVGDVLRMTCEEEPTLNKSYTVTQQGIILVDFIGAVHVEGNTEAEAARIVSARLVDERILRRATVTIRIVNTTVLPVTYRGAVQATGQEPHREGLRLSDIIKKAQPREDTDLGRIEVRGKDGNTRLVDFTRNDPATNADNPLMQPGDVVTFFVRGAPGLVVILGGVERPGGVTFERGMTVRSAIAKAGGLAVNAVATTVRLERVGRPPVMLDLTNPGTDQPVQEGDRVIVAVAEKRNYVQVSGAVNKGGFIDFRPGITVTQAIDAAGGLRADAIQDRVRLTRNGENRATVLIYADLKSGRATDPVLNPGDKIMVDARSIKKNDVLQSLTLLVLLYILIGR